MPITNDEHIAADDSLPLFEGEKMILADLLSHDTDVLSEVLGYDVDDERLAGLRRKLDVGVTDTAALEAKEWGQRVLASAEAAVSHWLSSQRDHSNGWLYDNTSIEDCIADLAHLAEWRSRQPDADEQNGDDVLRKGGQNFRAEREGDDTQFGALPYHALTGTMSPS